MRPLSLFVVICICLFLSAPAFAWGTKEHILLTRLAVLRILDDPTSPEALKQFLKVSTPDLTDAAGCRTYFLTSKVGAEPKGLEGLSHWVVLPDIRANGDRTTRIEPFGVPERPLHFVDLELLHDDIEKRVYRHDLSTRLPIGQAPADYKDERYRKAGYLHFAAARSYEKLVSAFREKRLVPNPEKPLDEDHAARWTGYLAHYAQDNFQPQHATQDYKSESYFADRRKAPNVHSEVEWRMNDDEKNEFAALRADYYAALEKLLPDATDPAAGLNDVQKETLLIADLSYAQLPLIGLAAMNAAGQAGTPDKPVGPAGAFDTEKFFRFETEINGIKTGMIQMKARQQAMAVVRTASIIRRAWDEAHK